ncbi:coiled-coil domain-containing protein [Salegentibacter sediminis]|uniref:hypothetical protein n=1 Tax=Salegentibacter sediminis TaxID=1930251 RepID=UPI0009BD1228|nr:hypothetical protein [Salegentibacter sediminis]
METVKIAELKINTDSLLQSMKATKAQINDLKKAQKELKDSGEENSTQFIQNAADLKTANSTYRAQEKTLQEVTGATKNLTNELKKEVKTLGDAEANNKALRKARKEVNISTEQGRAALDNINKKIDQNTDFMKENQDSHIKQKMNVGNYKDSILEATGAQETYTKGTQAMNAVQKVSAMVVGKSTGALKLFRIALASTGVGLLVIALGSLVTYLTQTQDGINAVNRVLTPLKQVVQTLKGQVQELGLSFAKLFTGDWQGFLDGIKSIGTTIKTDMGDAIARGKEIQRIKENLSKSEADFITQQGKLRQEYKEQNRLAEDQTKSLSEREAAARRTIEIQKEISKNATDRLNLEADLIALQQQANDTSDADRAELATKLADINDAIAAENEAVTTQQNKLNAIVREGEAKRVQYKKEAVVEKIQATKDEVVNEEEEQRKKLERIKEFEAEKRALEQELALMKAEDEIIRAEIQAEQDYEAHVRDIENMQLKEEEKTELLRLAQEKRNEILGSIQENFQEEMLKKFSETMREELSIRMQNAEETANIAYQLNGMLKGILGDSLAAQIAGIAIDAAIQAAKVNITTKAAQASNLANAAAIPFPANVPAMLAAQTQNTIIGASAAKATASILGSAALSALGTTLGSLTSKDTKKKFAKGGLLQGNSHANGGMIFGDYELEGNEAVINKKSTMKYGGVLSAINMAEGGNPIGNARPSSIIDYDILAAKIGERVGNAFSQVPSPVVSVSEISKTSERVQQIKAKAKF